MYEMWRKSGHYTKPIETRFLVTIEVDIIETSEMSVKIFEINNRSHVDRYFIQGNITSNLKN